MKLVYDPEADAAYLYLKEGGKAARTVTTDEDVNLDFDADGRLLGIEILSAKARLSPELLKKP
jgi:uncharacterized protein YuzE